MNPHAAAIKIIAVAILVIALFAMKAQNNALKGDLALTKLERDVAKKANEQNVRVIEGFAKQRIDNDAIATAVAKKLDGNRARTEGQRAAIRNAQNDPTVRDWAAVPVPDSVQRALEPPVDRIP